MQKIFVALQHKAKCSIVAFLPQIILGQFIENLGSKPDFLIGAKITCVFGSFCYLFDINREDIL